MDSKPLAINLVEKIGMTQKTDLLKALNKNRQAQDKEVYILENVKEIFAQNDRRRHQIGVRLKRRSKIIQNSFNFDLLDADRIVHIDAIKATCVDYRLRFLDTSYFKNEFPEEAVSKIRALEKEHELKLEGFKIMAPTKLFKLENADDPLLFAPMGNGYYYLIHKWGNDLHYLRKLMVWPVKNFENLVLSVFLLSLFLTSISPMQLFSKEPAGMPEYLMLFLFMFKAVAAVVLYYGFAAGKNFNTAIWDSKYFNA